MRPTAPNLRIIFQNVELTSPPQTPTATSPVFCPDKNPGAGASVPQARANLRPMSQPPYPRSFGNGPNFGPLRPPRPDQLSPQSSSLSSAHSESDPSDSDSDSSSELEPAPSPSPSPTTGSAPGSVTPTPATNGRVVTRANFTVEELSDFGDSDDDRRVAIRPHAIEDADSDRSRSKSPATPEIDRNVMDKFQNLNYDSSSDETDIDEDEFRAFLQQARVERRRKRMTSGSIGKRTISESIGSDTDLEDLRLFIGPDQAGSTARRLRRKVGERASLQFADPPLPRIDQMDEPPTSDDEILDDRALKELPYYKLDYIAMEIDSP